MQGSPSANTPSIMLIDDDPAVHTAIRGMFHQMGYPGSLVYCSRATHAMAKLGPCPPSRLPVSILLDLQMPGMNGIQFLRMLRSMPNLKHLRVYIVTSSTRGSDREKAKALGAAGFLPKVNHGFDMQLARQMFSPVWAEPGAPAQAWSA